jgi:ATP-dependent helicase HrpB
LQQNEQGDVLVFLPGIAEIRRCETKLAELASQRDLDIVSLHGSLPTAEQDRALRPSSKQKVILSTNVAETSLTIEGVRAVIDCGTARIARHSPWTGLSSLEVEAISQASAKQRAGRAGRTAAGRCIRLYDAHDLKGRRAFDTPEMMRSDLASCVLDLAARGESFDSLQWLTMPPEQARMAAEELLVALGAIEEGQLTKLGERMGKLPTHPRLARLVLAAHELGVAELGARAAALLSERPLRAQQRRGEEAQASSSSDVLDDLDTLDELKAGHYRSNRARILGVSISTAKSIEKAASLLLKNLPKQAPSEGDDDEALRRALLCAFPDRVARRVRPREHKLLLCKGGAVTQSRASAVIDAEYLLAIDVESRKNFQTRGALVRVASEIDPSWLLDLDTWLSEVDVHEYDTAGQRVVRRTGIYYGDVQVDEELIVDPNRMNFDEAKSALKSALLAGELSKVVDTPTLEAYQRRIDFVAKHFPEMNWLKVDENAQCEALLSMVERPTRLAELKKASLVDALYWGLSSDQRKVLDAEAPTHVSIPGRKRVAVNYEVDRPPWIQSRLQDFFGAHEAPRIAGGRVVLTLHLLAPNRRAVQVTTDLAGFWERHYPALRKQLMRRYPRHKWPEDPTNHSSQ